MNLERSCGAIVYTRKNGRLLFVIVREMAGAFSFPKGHMEENETEKQTARRELLEETGLDLPFLDGFRETDTYELAEKPGTRKQVTYFLAEYGGEPLFPRPGEIREILLLTPEQALDCFDHESTRCVLRAACRFLEKRHQRQ